MVEWLMNDDGMDVEGSSHGIILSIVLAFT
jgi:hypothetical protein